MNAESQPRLPLPVRAIRARAGKAAHLDSKTRCGSSCHVPGPKIHKHELSTTTNCLKVAALQSNLTTSQHGFWPIAVPSRPEPEAKPLSACCASLRLAQFLQPFRAPPPHKGTQCRPRSWH